MIRRDREVHSIPPRPLSINLWGDKNIVASIIAPLDVGPGLAADLLVIVSQKVSNIFFILPNFLGPSPSLEIVSYITLFPVVPNRSSAPKMSQISVIGLSPQQPKKGWFSTGQVVFLLSSHSCLHILERCLSHTIGPGSTFGCWVFKVFLVDGGGVFSYAVSTGSCKAVPSKGGRVARQFQVLKGAGLSGAQPRGKS